MSDPEPRYGITDFNLIGAPANGNGAARSEHDSWAPIYLSGVPDEPAAPPSLGYNLVYPALRHVFSGPQESAKTLVAYAVGIDVIRAHPGRQIMLFDYEMGPRAAKRRLRELGATDAELDANILYLSPDTPASLERIWLLVAMNPLLAIIDAAAGAFDNEGLDDNKRQDAEKWRKLYVDPFFDNGIATITLDHVVKDSETRGKYTIGSERKTGGGEVHIGFDTIKPIKRGGSGVYKMILHKDREGHHERGHFLDLHINSDPETHALTLDFKPASSSTTDTGEFFPTYMMEKGSRAIQLEPEAVSTNTLIGIIGGNKPAAGAAVRHLIRLGYITSAAGPNRSQLLTHNRLFTEAAWEAESAPTVPVPPSTPQVPPGATNLLGTPPTTLREGIGTGGTGEAEGKTSKYPRTAQDDDDGIPF